MYEVPQYRVTLTRQGAVEVDDSPKVLVASAAYQVLRSHLVQDGTERVAVLLLDKAQRIVGVLTVAVGSAKGCEALVKEVFAPALVHGAAGVIVGHNHPSGNPKPSRQDVVVTKRWAAAGSILGIPLMDHIILADGRKDFVSLHERGLI